MESSIKELASLQQLRHAWWAVFRDVVDTLLPVLALGPLLILAVLNFAASFVQVQATASAQSSWLVWLASLNPLVQVPLAVVLTACICSPLLITAVGRYPAQADVELNQRRRSAMDLSDKVSAD